MRSASTKESGNSDTLAWRRTPYRHTYRHHAEIRDRAERGLTRRRQPQLALVVNL